MTQRTGNADSRQRAVGRLIAVALLATTIGVTLACSGDRAEHAAPDASPPAATSSGTTEVPRYSSLTGCLERGTIPGTFVLTETGSSEIGTSGSRENQASASYPLMNKGDTDLTNYVGSRVTVSGRFQVEADAPAADRAPGVAERTGAAPEVRELIVEKVERTEGVCGAAGR